MAIKRLCVAYWRDENGATTIDWVVITAAVVGITIALLTTIGGATSDYWDTVGSAIDDRGIPTY